MESCFNLKVHCPIQPMDRMLFTQNGLKEINSRDTLCNSIRVHIRSSWIKRKQEKV